MQELQALLAELDLSAVVLELRLFLLQLHLQFVKLMHIPSRVLQFVPQLLQLFLLMPKYLLQCLHPITQIKCFLTVELLALFHFSCESCFEDFEFVCQYFSLVCAFLELSELLILLFIAFFLGGELSFYLAELLL